jgi:hypothetical protein
MRNNLKESEDLNRWDVEKPEDEACPNIFKFLCNNINNYDLAYRRESQ